MGRHHREPQTARLRWTDWAFVGVMTIVSSTGAYLFVVYLFDRLGV